MNTYERLYIDGGWVTPKGNRVAVVTNPATEEKIADVALADSDDVDLSVAAARNAFSSFSNTSVAERIALLEAILAAFRDRLDDIAAAITLEVGAPLTLSKRAQAATGIAHLEQATKVLKDYRFIEVRGKTAISREPIGVCGLITPWNWPINQIMCKVAPALAAGCAIVLKPSEVAPLNAILLAEVMHAAGVPPGVFNLVHGDGEVGQAIAIHPDIDMVSFTGSTSAGILVAKAAADTVKRVHQELGGKSAAIVLGDADLSKSVSSVVRSCFLNSGQSCNAPTRLFVPKEKLEQAAAVAKGAAEAVKLGNPMNPETTMGPVVNRRQFERIQRMLEIGVEEGATLVAGGPGRPSDINHGYFVRPTVFADVMPKMAIAREEIFGPVMSILGYTDDMDAIAMANDTPYGLAGYVHSSSIVRARDVARQLRAGTVHINGASPDFSAPFGGYKQSGNGREWGAFGMEDFMEVKATMGYEA